MNEQLNPGVVLIVEDADTCATTLEVALDGVQGLGLVLADTGLEALRILRQRGGPVRAVVTDLNMPRMSGMELIRNIRADSGESHLPIIVISGDPDPRTPARACHAGADAYFSKPYSPAEVRHKLEQLLNATQPPGP